VKGSTGKVAGDQADDDFERALHGLIESERPLRFGLDPGLTELLDELRGWLADELQWRAAYGDQWVSLLDDVLASHGRSAAGLSSHLDGAAEAWEEIAACRRALKKQGTPRAFDAALRRRLQQAAEELHELLLEPEALGKVFDDLLDAPSFDAARTEGRRLWLSTEAQGLDAKGLIRRISEVLEDDLMAIKRERGEEYGVEDRRKTAELDQTARVALARSVLFKPPRRVSAIIWLSYTLAPFGGGRLELGEAVTIYSAAWLRSTLGSGDTTSLPPELRAGNDNLNVEILAGIHRSTPGGESTQEAEEKPEDEIPQALVRVVLGTVASAEALALAEESAELIVSLASLQGAEPSTWLLTSSYARYYDGKPAGASFHASPIGGLSLEQRRALRLDPIAAMAEEWAEELPPHLPLRRADLRALAQLALWLRRSRETWEPGRIVLCDRVFEQVAGWAGVGERRRFFAEYLRLPWALRRVRQEINGCWTAVVPGPLGPEDRSAEGRFAAILRAPEIDFEPLGGGRYTINLQGVLRRLDLLSEAAGPDPALQERVRRLDRRTATGGACAAWVKDLTDDFDGFARRERRVRNALVHGGPVSDEIAASVLGFVDSLAAEALHASIKGMLGEGDVVDHFLARRREYELALLRLRAGEAPTEALFW
jgi:hypothetical protein